MSGANGSAFGIGALVSQGLNAPEQMVFSTADPVVLGTVLFDNFEIPAQINFGGTQKLTVHTLPGGERIIDTMGRDEDPITCSGIFLGRGALDRAKAMDVMRAAGNPQQFTFGTLSYTVILQAFKADYKFSAHIPFSITLTVVRDNAAPVPDNSVGAVPDDVSSAGDAIPQDAPPNLITKTTAETGPTAPVSQAGAGSSVTQTYQPIDQGSGSLNVDNGNIGSGNNLITPNATSVDLGPSSSLTADAPDPVVADFNQYTAQQAAQASADSLAANPTAGLSPVLGLPPAP